MINGKPSLYKRIENDISQYTTSSIELSERVSFSQFKTINRIYRFRNRDLSGSKLNSDLSYDYFFDIISPRIDSEVKNLRFDSKNILAFSQNPTKDFAAVFIANASIKHWMNQNGEAEKLKAAVEEFTTNGNVLFKKIKGGYEFGDVLNTYITNQKAETVDDTDIIERHEMTASQLTRMTEWEKIDETIEECGNKTFTAASTTTPIESTGKRYEIFEFSGEVSEKEFNEVKGIEIEGDEDTYFLAKVIVAGLSKGGKGETYTLFAEKLKGKLSDHYVEAHRGRYEGRFWRVGMVEMLMDHQIRANQIANDIARGLEWASKVIFKSKDTRVLQNIRADMDNGDVVITEDLAQVDVRLNNLDQLIADWNRLMTDADRLTNATEIVRGEVPSGTPFRMGILMDQNAGKMFAYLRQKISLPYKRVFKEWIMPELIKDLKGEDIFRLVGENEILDQLREIMVESWYIQNLVQIGPHTQEVADQIKAEKLDQLKKLDPAIKNVKSIWEGVLPRLFITITGENSDIADQIQDLLSMLNLEKDPDRVAWILDTIYKSRGIPIPPKKVQAPVDSQVPGMQQDMQSQGQPQQGAPQGQPSKVIPSKTREAQQPTIQQ